MIKNQRFINIALYFLSRSGYSTRNIQKYKKTEHYHFKKQRTVTFDINTIKIIWDNLDEVQELYLGYIKFDDNTTFNTSKWSGVFIENLSQP